ncbi:cytosolic non-specific dipeptidase-like isoform X3 [Alosa sapidissima]|uniref:cytosolic non-specific dipeptidase-like isoform X3 n=1 Tax=Alosa sapidissima TaxID=34773 RepID=UPI001C096F8E|nr:cytosolic non-specific dipeptidase-like isoform X3 [Alosa sapidissima]
MMEMAAKDIEKLGGTVELVDIGKQELADGQEIPLPPIILGRLGSDPGKKTVCIYGHLDVQPANIDDGWDTEPFKLVEKDGKLYGRGSTDDKGPVLAWFNCIEAYQKTKQVLKLRSHVSPRLLYSIVAEGAAVATGGQEQERPLSLSASIPFEENWMKPGRSRRMWDWIQAWY